MVSTAVAALCVAGVAELTGPWWSQVFATLDYDTPLRLAVWTTVPVAVVASCQALLRAKDAAGRFVVVTILATLGAQGAGLVGLLVADGEPSVYLGGMLIGVCLAALAGVLLAEAIVLPAGIVVLRRALAIGLPTVPHSLAALALVAADRVVVENELGLAEAGRYQLAYLLGASAVSVLIAVNNSWAPLIYGAGEDRWELLAETAHALHRLTPLLVAPLALGAPLLLSVVADDSYDPRSLSPVLAVTALTTCGYVAYLSNVHVLFVHRAVGFLAVATPSVAAVNVVGNLVLVPRFGLTAAAWTSVGSYALLGRAVRWRARRLAQVPWRPGTTLSAWLPASVVVGLALTLPVGRLVARGARCPHPRSPPVSRCGRSRSWCGRRDGVAEVAPPARSGGRGRRRAHRSLCGDRRGGHGPRDRGRRDRPLRERTADPPVGRFGRTHRRTRRRR